MKLDDLAHRAVAELRQAGEAADYAATSPSRHRRSARVRTAVVVLGVLALGVGIPWWLFAWRDGGPPPDVATLHQEETPGYVAIAGVEYPVGDLVDAFSAHQMFWPQMQPEPTFETGPLGDRLPLPVSDPRVPDDDVLNSPSIYLGELGPDSVFLAELDQQDIQPADDGFTDGSHPCIRIGEYQVCSVPAMGPWILRHSPGEVVVMWVGVPDGTAAVVVSGADGPLGWQVPRSRTVVVSVPLSALVMTALDADGRELMSFDLPSAYP